MSNVFASVPFTIMRGETVVDDSQDYTNALGWLPNPRHLLRLWMQSLIMTNRPYGFMEGRGKSITKMRYIAPQTVTKIETDANGITYFTRSIDGKSQRYSATDKRIFYAFNLDYSEELIPGDNTIFKSIASSAKIMLFADYWIEKYFERGGIRPHMLLVQGAPNPDARTRIEKAWTNLMRGVAGAIGKVWDAESIDAKPLGDA